MNTNSEFARNGKVENGRRAANGAPVLNRILARMPEHEFERVRPYLEYQEWPTNQVLDEPDRPVENAYFLNSGLASVEVPTREGINVEVSVVGNHGFLGIPLLCGARRAWLRTIVPMRSNGFAMKAEAMEGLLQNVPQLHLRMKRFALLQGIQVAQIAACNRLHDLEKRFARWLLMAADRVGAMLPITQDHLATMLGTGRASLSVVASRLRKRDMIRWTRGTLRILDRAGVENSCCECYEILRRADTDPMLSW